MRNALRAIRRKLLWLCVRWPRLCGFLFVVNDGFAAEHRTVLSSILSSSQGRELGAGAAGAGTAGHTHWDSLRQYIHVLEKGLSHKERREVFGRQYAPQAVRLFKRLSEDPQGTPGRQELLCWAGDVLNKYFSVVGSDPAIDGACAQFGQILKEIAYVPGEQVPYCRDTTPLRTGYDEMLQLAQRRRSVRWYRPEPVPRELLDRAVRVASLSPSACNKQPFHFRIYDDAALIKKVFEIPVGATGFSEPLPCVVVVTGDVRSWPAFATRHTFYIDACLAAMSFQYALEAQGLSSCCVHWSESPDRELAMSQLLGMPMHERVVLLITVGFPDPEGIVARSAKKTIEEIRSYNTVGAVF